MPLGYCLSRNLDVGSRLLAALGPLAALGFAGVVEAGTIDLSPCDLTASEGRQEVDAQCGTLAVPLDPADPGGASIELFVAVVEALAEQPSPDPLVVIAGGPGDAATRFFATAERRSRGFSVTGTSFWSTSAAVDVRRRCTATAAKTTRS